MKILNGLAAFLIAGTALFAQDKENKKQEDVKTQGEESFRILATPYEGDKTDVPARVHRLKEDDVVMRLGAKSFPDALHDLPGIYVQKTSPDRGTPIIRGMTSSRNVLIADGVRINNPVLREGPNEYWGLLDPFLYQNVEVIMGPGSVIYGSDAIGGVVLASSRALPRGEADAGLQFLGGDAYYRYGSAQNSNQEHLQFRLGYDDYLAFSMGYSRGDYGDLHMGDGTALSNSGYQTQGTFFRLEYDLDPRSTLLFGYDYYDIGDANRVHWTTSGESFHGTTVTGNPGRGMRIKDMDRHSTYLRYVYRDGKGIIKEADVGVSFMYMSEEEHRRRVNNNSARRTRWVDETWGANIRLVSDSPIGELTYGVDYYFDQVNSRRLNYNGAGMLTGVRLQGPVADDAEYHQLGIYLQDKIGLTNDLDLILGTRYNWVEVNANQVRLVPNGELHNNWNSMTHTAHLVYRINDEMNVYGGVSMGFRAPNLSDISRDGEFATTGTEIPNANLDPEYFTTYEMGLNINKEAYDFGVSVYYTDIDGMIVRQTNAAGIGKANRSGHMYGIELTGEYRFTSQWSVFGNLGYVKTHLDNHLGLNINNRLTGDQLSKVPPLHGLAGIKWQPNRKFYAEAYARMANDQDDLSQADRTDTSRIPPGGTPGYITYNMRFGYQLTESLDVSLDLENLADKGYRIHGSGQNGAGRSFTATLHYKF